ncbi:MAG: glycosyltransferase family 39 protein [Acidobacteriota bacterium]|nr:glycosyltransferase family 39 protein [Acidobacteriota bacterium]
MNLRIGTFYAGAAALLATLALGCVFTKAPTSDEAWFFNPVHNLLTSGVTGTSLLESRGMFWQGIETRTYWQPPVYFALQAGWLKILGLNLFAWRSLSVVAAIAALLLWRSTGRSLGLDRRVLLLAAIFFATDYTIVYSAANGRMDMLSAAFAAAGVAAYLRWREPRFNAAILWSHTAIALSGLTHPMGGMLALIAFGCLFASYGDWRRVRLRTVLLAVAPYLIGAAGWGVYILQDPQLFRAQFMGNVSGRVHGGLWPWLAAWREVRDRYLGTFGWRDSASSLTRWKLLIPAGYLAGLVTVCAVPSLRRHAGIRRVLLLLGAISVGLAYLDTYRFGTYLVHVIPLFLICAAAAVVWAWDRGGLLRALAASLALGFVILQAAGSAYCVLKDPYRRQYLPVTGFIRARLAPGDLIIGGAELVFDLGWNTQLLDDVTLGYYTGKTPAWIVVNARYQSWFPGFQKSDPSLYQFVRRRLENEFTPVFQSGEFTVYRRITTPAATSASRYRSCSHPFGPVGACADSE